MKKEYQKAQTRVKLYYSVLSVTFGPVPGVLPKPTLLQERSMLALGMEKKKYHRALILSYRLKEREIIKYGRENKVL